MVKNTAIQQQLQRILSEDKLCERYSIAYLGLFGSHARGEDSPVSDVDLYVKFQNDKKISLFDVSRLSQELERKTRKKYDLVTKLNKYVEPYIRKDLMPIYGKE